jgi:hypothetical protein
MSPELAVIISMFAVMALLDFSGYWWRFVQPHDIHMTHFRIACKIWAGENRHLSGTSSFAKTFFSFLFFFLLRHPWKIQFPQTTSWHPQVENEQVLSLHYLYPYGGIGESHVDTSIPYHTQRADSSETKINWTWGSEHNVTSCRTVGWRIKFLNVCTDPILNRRVFPRLWDHRAMDLLCNISISIY